MMKARMRPRTLCGSCSRFLAVTNVGSKLSSGFGPARRAGFSISVDRNIRASPGRLALGSFDALVLQALNNLGLTCCKVLASTPALPDTAETAAQFQVERRYKFSRVV